MIILKKSIHNVKSDTYEVLVLSDNEIAEIEARKTQVELNKIELEAKASAKAALLDRLGITADEAKLLLS